MNGSPSFLGGQTPGQGQIQAPAAAQPGPASAAPMPLSPEAVRQLLENNPTLMPGAGGNRSGARPAQTAPNPQQQGGSSSDQSPLNQAAKEAAESTSLTPKPGTFRFFVNQATGRNIARFGQELFGKSNTFSALQSQPVPTNYVVGPGDEILLKIFGGAVEFDQAVTVDRSGMINLPKVGPLSVSGLTVSELEPALRRHIGRVLSDFSLYVSMGALRGIEIYVVGQAATPGKFVVSSVSTLINALFATGGPSERGSMRVIEIIRDNKVVVKLDLYDFIAKGDRSKDMRLLPGDVINIPAVGPQVALVGSVAGEAIFELPQTPAVAFIKDVLNLSGGLPVITSPLQASLERIEPGRSRPLSASSVSLDEAGLNTPLKDGDILTLFPIKPAFENAVSLRLMGAAAVRIPIAQGARVSDVIPSREALLTSEFWLRRFQPEASTDKSKSRMDSIRNLAQIDQINWSQATIERIRKTDLTTEIISFDLGQAILQKESASDLMLEPGDIITVFSQRSVAVPQAKQTRVVQIEGEVNAPGIYQLKPGETLPQLLMRAGGLTPNAYVYGSELSRQALRAQQQKNIETFIRELETQAMSLATGTVNPSSIGSDAASQTVFVRNQEILRRQIERLRSINPSGRVSLELDPLRQRLPDVALEDGDIIRIPNPPGHVMAVGAVYNDSAIIHRPGRTVADYLKISGVSSRAESFNTFVVRADGTIVTPPREGIFSFNSDVSAKVASLELMPGDTIVVPEKLTQESGYSVFMRGLKDWTQVLYQLGLSAAAIKVLK